MTFDGLGEMFIDGSWVDVTGDIQHDGGNGVTISRGVSGISASASPTSCSFMLDNTTGNYSPDNPSGDYYGLIGNNTPFRYSMPGYESRLELDGTSGGYASTPHSSTINLTDGLDVVVELDADFYSSQTSRIIAQKYSDTTGQRAWRWRVGEDGYFYFDWWDSSNNFGYIYWLSTFLPGRAIRVIFDTDNGSSGVSLTAYYADGVEGDWKTGFTYSDSLGTSSIKSTSSSPLCVGGDSTSPDTYHSVPGFYRKFRLLNLSGNFKVNIQFTDQTAGDTSFVSAFTGETWTVNGTGVITDRDYRFSGEIATMPVQWNQDWVYVTATAGGIRRRLEQGQKPTLSALAKRVPRDGPKAYWPLEDGENATTFASPIDGVKPALLANLDLASRSDLPSSAPLPVLNGSATALPQLKGSCNSGGTGEWAVAFVYYMPSDTLTSTVYSYMTIDTTGSAANWRIQMDDTFQSTVAILDSDGNVITGGTIATGSDIADQWVYCRIYAYQSGTSVKWSIAWTSTTGVGGSIAEQTLTSQSLGSVIAVGHPDLGFNPAMNGLALGHISVWDTKTVNAYTWQPKEPFATALNSFSGEHATERIGRVAVDYGIPVVLRSETTEEQKVGYQLISTPLALMDEAAAADGGLLIDDREQVLMRYTGKTALYSQTAVEVAYDQLQPGLTPNRDDTELVNAFTAQRVGGSSGYAELADDSRLSIASPPTGSGLYQSSGDFTLFSDEQAPDIASWQVALGTIDAPRYAAVEIELMKDANSTIMEDIQGLDVGGRLKITNCPAGKTPPGTQDLFIRGYTERITHFTWNFQFNCLPYGPRRALVWEAATGTADGDNSRWDTDGSAMNSTATTTATSISVKTTSGAIWTTDTDDMPFDILVAGEQMTVTAVSGSSSPQTFTVTRSVNDVVKTHAADEPVQLAFPSYWVL